MRISKNVFFMGLASFLVDIHSEIIMPLLPLFLTGVLGVNRAFVGLVEGIADATASLLKAPSGWLSDRMGKRKPMVFSGYALSTLCKPLLYFARTGFGVLFVRFGDRAGKGIRTAPRDALIADSCQPNEKGRSFGFHRMMDTSGAVLGAAFASLLMILFSGNYRMVFLIATIPGVLALIIFAIFVKDVKPTFAGESRESGMASAGRPPYAGESRESGMASVGRPAFAGELKFFLAVATIFSLGNFSYALFILGAKELGMSAALIPIVYLFYNVIYAGVAQPAGILSDRIGRRPILIASYAAFVIVCLGFATVKSQVNAWWLFAFYGIHSGLVEAVSRAYVSDMTEPSTRATVLGIYHMLIGLAVLPASFIGGLLWDKFGRAGCFCYGAVLATAALLLLAFYPLACIIKLKWLSRR